jgi:site-specific DNA-methyltransferase (adenine-specific)
MIELNKIYNMDCVEGMRMLPDECIDLTVTSPPYDNLRTYNGFEWNFEETAKNLYRVTKQGGVVVWVVGDATVKGSETGTSFKQALFFKECGFNLHDTMIWYKPDGFNFGSNYAYKQSFEYMFVFSKGKPKTINKIKDVPSKLAGKTIPSVRKHADGKIDRDSRVYIQEEFKYRPNVWAINRPKKNNGHPAVFPEQLANDHIISWSNEGDLVFDPFAGSGTTPKMAVLNNRKYMGFEISKEYFDITNNRIDEAKTQGYQICL